MEQLQPLVMMGSKQWPRDCDCVTKTDWRTLDRKRSRN